jgi:hypothetical protein
VIFTLDSALPVGITKNVTNDTFTVTNAGTYLVTVTMIGQSDGGDTQPCNIRFSILATGHAPFTNAFATLPDPTPGATTSGVNLSAQMEYDLAAGATIQVQAFGIFTNAIMDIFFPQISITQIAP